LYLQLEYTKESHNEKNLKFLFYSIFAYRKSKITVFYYAQELLMKKMYLNFGN